MSHFILIFSWICFLQFFIINGLQGTNPPNLELIKISPDNKHFVKAVSGEKFIPWGVNYDHNEEGALLEEYWNDNWDVVVEDFEEIKALNCNVVRIHLQLGRIMKTAKLTDSSNLRRLAKLLELAEEKGLYLDITGLGCYHKQNVPAWYDRLSESERWEVQCRFWQAVANVCKESPAVFCYDLMNEPILPGKKPETEWLTGELGGKFFVQRIALHRKGRNREAIAKAWVTKLTEAIRENDKRHMITVGVIPWALSFKGAKPIFYDPEVGENLDFVSVHFYPRKDQIDEALRALKVYDIDKPLVIEEMFPLKCSIKEMDTFIDSSRKFTDGWISFYWGKTIKEYKKGNTISDSVKAKWLQYFRKNSPL